MVEAHSLPRDPPAGVLAEFLLAEKDAIVHLFTERIRTTVAPESLSESQLVDHLPEFLTETARALSSSVWPTQLVFTRSSTALAHGRQRERVGYDLNALVREYGLLRDCIFERMEEAKLRPTLREIRTLSDCLSGGIADSVNEYMRQRREGADAERRHLAGLFEQAPGFVAFLRGRELVFELANAAYYQLVGHRKILEKPVREALPELAGQGFFELLDTAFASGKPFVGRAMRVMLQHHPGGPTSEVFVDLVFQPIRDADGTVTGILVHGYEVTQVKRLEAKRQAVEEALRASEERYRTLFESIHDGFCLLEMIVDAQGEPVDYRFLETNAAFEGQTGLRNAVGKTARELVPDLDPSWWLRYGEVARTGEPARFESREAAMDRAFEVYASRAGNPDLRHVALVFKDVSERKRVEAERERLLERESAARREAEQAGRLRDEFLATVSHELRTPLNSMLGWVQMLRSGGLAPEKRERALETIERNARAQTQLIEDLLDVSGILAGKLRLQVETLEVQSIVEAALETVRPAADAKDIRMQATLGSGATVMGDPQRLQQVVWNLLSNAVKFTPKGGRVQVLLERRDSSVVLTVADTGLGIASEFQPHVFERFRQAEGGTTRAYGGLGLGLSIVRQLVEMHGGTVTVFSEGEGRGATFTVRLPLAVTLRRELGGLGDTAREERFQCPPELDGLAVLVVDDEGDTREMLRTLLEGCGARVQLAASAAEALRIFREAPPAILLSDVGMPEEDGYALVEKIRQLPPEAGGKVPAVALTAYARTGDRTHALLSGFSSHLPKPVDPLELVAVIASLSGRSPKRGA